MKNNNPYKSFSSYILRSPLFSINFYNNLFSCDNTDEERLKAVYNDKSIQEAVYLASPSLYDTLISWLCEDEMSNKSIASLHNSMYKYIARMTSRSTPFGIFAGISRGSFSRETNIQRLDHKKNRTHSRLDMDYLCTLSRHIEKDNSIKKKLRFFPNSSLHLSMDRYSYVEYRYKNSNRTHHTISVEYSEYIEEILKFSSNGAYMEDTALHLMKYIEKQNGIIEYEEVMEFIYELIDSQILISELEPAITNREFMDQITSTLEGIEGSESYINFLSCIREKFNKIDNSDIGDSVPIFDQIAEIIDKSGINYQKKFLFQSDMILSTSSNTINYRYKKDVLKGLSILNRLTSKDSSNNRIENFKKKYLSRYEHKEMPLLQVLDPESGISYNSSAEIFDNSPLIDDLSIISGQASQEFKIEPSYVLLKNKLNNAFKTGDKIISISESDLKSFDENWDNFPATISTRVNIFKDRMDDDFKIYFEGIGGSSAVNLMSRFAYSDKSICDYLYEIKESESLYYEPGFILAEIVHLPMSRVGNVLAHPVFHKHEIPYLAKASLDDPNVIKLDDIVIGVKGDSLYLRSLRHDKYIIPRLTNAHNYTYKSLPLYTFLCDMQFSIKRRSALFSWGILEEYYDYFPRVEYKNIVFSPEKWKINGSELSGLDVNNRDKLLQNIRKWRERRSIPEMFIISEDDNTLLINSNNYNSVIVFLNSVKGYDSFFIKESLFYGNDEYVVNGEGGSYTNEFIFSYYRED